MNTRVLFRIGLAVALSVAAGGIANAEIIAYEGFDFTVDHMNYVSRGTDTAGWSPYGGWEASGCGVPDGSGLTYLDLLTKGNACLGAPGHTAAKTYRNLAERYTDGQFWISFLLLSTSPVEGDGTANLNLVDTQFVDADRPERVAFGFTYRHTQEYGSRWEPDIQGHGFRGTGIARKEGPALLVVKYDFGTGYDGSSSLYVDPPLGPNPPSWPDAYEGGIPKSDMPFDRIRVELRESPLGSVMMLDEIRIGRSWTDVTPVPEPSSAVLLGIGAVGLLAYAARKRRHAGTATSGQVDDS